MIDWLYRSAWEISILVSAIIILNPIIRRLLNARVAYWFWILPFATVVLWDKPARPDIVMTVTVMPYGGVTLSGVPINDVLAISNTAPLLWIWALGFLIYALFRIVSYLKFRRVLQRYSESYIPGKAILASLPTSLKSQKIKYFTSSLSGAPFVTGALTPEIYLPEDFEESYSTTKQKWILVHELTHVQRKDLWAQLAAEFVRGCFWFNPIVYFADSFFREDQELACDYQALRNCDISERVQYGEAMLQGMSANLLPATLAFFTLKKERFVMLQKHKKSMTKNIVGGMLCTGLAFFILTEAPSSIAIDSKSDENGLSNSSTFSDTLTLKVEKTPLEQVVGLIAGYVQMDLFNRNLLNEKNALITVNLEYVPALEALEFILTCNNLSYELQDDKIKIIEFDSYLTNTEECLQLVSRAR